MKGVTDTSHIAWEFKHESEVSSSSAAEWDVTMSLRRMIGSEMPIPAMSDTSRPHIALEI